MKERRDLVRGWLRKAQSNLVTLDASIAAGALDAAAFHSQQAAEKYPKAFLVSAQQEFPFTHNLTKLVSLCAAVDPAFKRLLAAVEPLTPYAVELRYDADFWPSEDDARTAHSLALQVRDFVMSRLSVEYL